MFARVVPVLRTPIGVDVFDYRVPTDFSPRVGDLVRVPFRKRVVPALVVELLTSSPYAAKALTVIDAYAELSFPPSLVELLHWTAARTFTSEPTVLAAWLRNLPKRPTTLSHTTPRARTNTTPAKLIAHWQTDAPSALVDAAKQALLKKKSVLIITPWKNRVLHFQKVISDSQGLHSDLAAGRAFQAWQQFVCRHTRCLITTRLGAWLSPMADVVLIDEPENDDHKQDDLAPRYDARLIAAWSSRHAGSEVEGFGLTPPLHTRSIAPEIQVDLKVVTRQPQGRSPIPMIQADTLLAIREHTGPCVVVHPIRGLAASLVCRDCGWRASCLNCGFGLRSETNRAVCRQCGNITDPPVVCGSCGGPDLGKALPGIERLKQAWQKFETETAVTWRDLSNESIDAPLPDNALVVVTEAHFLGGVAEDIRRTERQNQAFRRLAARVAQSHGSLIIQSEAASAETWARWLTQKGMEEFQARERHERELFHYPPATRLVKILYDGKEAQAIDWMEKAKKILGNDVKLRGPFAIPFRSRSQSERFVWHLLLPPELSEAALLSRLTPLAGSAIIDLDPIAFFR